MNQSPPAVDLWLQDEEWPLEYIDHDREIARAIVFDESDSSLSFWFSFYFVHAERYDEFGPASVIETSGGGVEPGESPEAAVLREIREELGIDAEILCKIGFVSDYYNLIHRHNLNHYYLCKVRSFGERNMTPEESELLHLSMQKLSYEDAVAEYQKCATTKLGRLIARRELPILEQAHKILAEWNMEKKPLL